MITYPDLGLILSAASIILFLWAFYLHVRFTSLEDRTSNMEASFVYHLGQAKARANANLIIARVRAKDAQRKANREIADA